MNKRIILSAYIALSILITIVGCGSSQSTTNNTDTTTGTSQQLQPQPEKVTPNSEVLSIKEFIDVFANETSSDSAMAKYGYRMKKNYEVFRVDKYDKMYYKNCRLAKIITDGKYDDYPRALRNGISSYVAVKGESMMLGVFNDNAYQNLVGQVKAEGFNLSMEGNEDIYSNGTYYIACNKNYRTVRIQKVSAK